MPECQQDAAGLGYPGQHRATIRTEGSRWVVGLGMELGRDRFVRRPRGSPDVETAPPQMPEPVEQEVGEHEVQSDCDPDEPHHCDSLPAEQEAHRNPPSGQRSADAARINGCDDSSTDRHVPLPLPGIGVAAVVRLGATASRTATPMAVSGAPARPAYFPPRRESLHVGGHGRDVVVGQSLQDGGMLRIALIAAMTSASDVPQLDRAFALLRSGQVVKTLAKRDD